MLCRQQIITFFFAKCKNFNNNHNFYDESIALYYSVRSKIRITKNYWIY